MTPSETPLTTPTTPHLREAVAVQPHCVMAAARQSFEVTINTDHPTLARSRLWKALPLEEHGWDFGKLSMILLRKTRVGFVWRVSRT